MKFAHVLVCTTSRIPFSTSYRTTSRECIPFLRCLWSCVSPGCRRPSDTKPAPTPVSPHRSRKTRTANLPRCWPKGRSPAASSSSQTVARCTRTSSNEPFQWPVPISRARRSSKDISRPAVNETRETIRLTYIQPGLPSVRFCYAVTDEQIIARTVFLSITFCFKYFFKIVFLLILQRGKQEFCRIYKNY